MSSQETNSTDDLNSSAYDLILKLNRKNIFPPILNPSDIIGSIKFDERKKQKRTPNGFFICRMNVTKEAERIGIKINMRLAIKATSILWKNALNEEKNEYLQLADKIKCYCLRNSSTNKQDQFDHYNVFQLSKETNELYNDNSKQNYLNDYNINSNNNDESLTVINNNDEQFGNSFIQYNENYSNNINEFYYGCNNDNYYLHSNDEIIFDSNNNQDEDNFDEYFLFF